MDDPVDEIEMESVKSVFNYLSGLGRGHWHRSCPMNYIHYPVDFKTLEDHGKTVEKYDKAPHQLICNNKHNEKQPEAPYKWSIMPNVTCRDWKVRYCCENSWGTPSSFSILIKKANFKIQKSREISETDVFVDHPLRRDLFQDCRWGGFMR